MSIRNVRRLAIFFFLLYAVMVTWPGVLPFRAGRPFVLGLPFPLVWATAWIVGGLVVLVLLDRAEDRAQHADTDMAVED